MAETGTEGAGLTVHFTGPGAEPRIFLAYATPDFAPFGVPTPRVPLFYNRDSMELLEIPTRWMFYLALERGRVRSLKTWKAYAENLLDWLRHCDANGWPMLGVVEGHLGAYRRQMLCGQTVNGDRFADATINARLNNVARFYEWLYSKRLIATYPFAVEEARISHHDRGLLGFARGATPYIRRQNALPVRKKIPKAIPIDVLREIRSPLRERDRIVVDWSLVTGARQDEVLGIDLTQIPDVSKVRGREKVEVRITKTKGLRPRTLLVPIKLLDRVWRYINTERAAVLRNTRHRGKSPDRRALFLSERGLRLSAKTLHAAFHRAVLGCGASCRFHDLRHTFAIHRLTTLERAKRADGNLPFDPLLRLRDDLGHTDLKATQVYLEAMKQDTSRVEESLMTLLDQLP